MSASHTISTVVRSALDAAFSGDLSGYAALDRKERASFRSSLDAALKTSVANGDIAQGQSVLSVLSAVSELSKKSEKREVDPKVAIAQHVANLRMAADMLASGAFVPDGVNSPVVLDESDIPEGSAEVARKLANVRIGKKSRENDIPALIRSAFANDPIGTFRKVSEIRTQLATMYPEKGITADWDGRLNAALFTNNGGKGIVGLESVDLGHSAYKGRKGAMKVESDIWDEEPNSDDSDNED